jgi:hypothetical protein
MRSLVWLIVIYKATLVRRYSKRMKHVQEQLAADPRLDLTNMEHEHIYVPWVVLNFYYSQNIYLFIISYLVALPF